ncbi:UNVERIFIED_CONTAM: hypothetical protein Slati_2663700 [Sesamum latifolium]|uniref:RNase H type-1 domain-containing protein n=1 Tax=Sesamum latifolium TaxID=2727402 RepID=A0AAW2VUD5_9LAMI
MEVYVDDILVKSKERKDHIEDLAECFAQLKKGIEANPDKIMAIRRMKELRSIKEVQQLTGKIAALNRFISRAADRGLPFFKILINTKNFQWTDKCKRAFTELKSYLERPPLLSKSMEGERLWIYLALSNEATRRGGKVQPPREARPGLGAHGEKVTTLLLVTPPYRPHWSTFKTRSATKHGSRMVKWSYELNKLDVEYRPRKAIKAQALADFIADCPLYEAKEETTWTYMLMAWPQKSKHGEGWSWQTQGGLAFGFDEVLSNNEAEYEALLCGLKIAQENGVRRIKIHSDSQP